MSQALDFFETPERIERIARALANIDGVDPDRVVHMNAADVALYTEALRNAYPIIMYGPHWMKFRREAFRYAAAIDASVVVG